MGTGTGSIDLSTLNNLHTNLTQHFWFNSNAGAAYGTGVHMTLSSQAEFIANPTGQNILMNTDGISIRSGLIPLMVLDNDSLDFNVVIDQTQGTYRNVASFGASARIGARDGYRAVIDEGSYVILSPDNVELFSFKPSGNPSLDIVAVREDAVGGESTSITLNHTPQSGSFMVFYWTTNSAQQLTTFRAGEAKTTTVGERFRISYDGDKTITIDSLDESSTAYVDYVVYRYISNSIDLGALTVGTRQSNTDLGSGSATIGRDLTATQSYQIAVGVMNEGFEDSVFEVGNGKNETRHTAFSVHNNNAIREGYNTTASGDCSHSEGRYTTASGSRSHSEGGFSTASGDYSHAEGYNSTASGHTSHAEGSGTKASGICSHAEGSDTIASSDYQHVEGMYNIEDTNSKYAHIIGNGSSEGNRSNALTVDWDGTIRTGENSMKTLLSTTSYMNGNQDLTFSEPVSEQLTGIVLVWSWWSGSQAEDWGWETFFIPKAMVQLHNGVGYDCPLSRPKSSYFGHKYVYIHDTHIKGHADNVATGTANNVPYQNNKWVLRYVFGC